MFFKMCITKGALISYLHIRLLYDAPKLLFNLIHHQFLASPVVRKTKALRAAQRPLPLPPGFSQIPINLN